MGNPPPPRGLRRRLLRLPLIAYRLHLGWLFGRRLVRVDHVGRRSGHVHQVVLEVVDRDPRSGAVTVASGFGGQADWYRNLLAHPQVTVSVGVRRQIMTAWALPREDGARCMVAYAGRHRRLGRRLARFMGYEVDGSDADFAALGRLVPFVRLDPVDDEGCAPAPALLSPSCQNSPPSRSAS